MQCFFFCFFGKNSMNFSNLTYGTHQRFRVIKGKREREKKSQKLNSLRGTCESDESKGTLLRLRRNISPRFCTPAITTD